MKFQLNKCIITLCLVVSYCQAFSQSKFHDLVKASYECTDEKEYGAAIALLNKARALKGIDTGYNESVYLFLGQNHEALGNLNSCIDYYGKAIIYHEKNKDSAKVAYIYSQLSGIEIRFTKQYVTALEDLRNQIIYSKLPLDTSKLMSYGYFNNRGLAYKGLGKYDSSLFYYNIVLSSSYATQKEKTKTLRQIGDVYARSGKLDSALVCYDRAIANSTVLKDTAELFTNFSNKGECLLTQRRFSESLHFLEQSQQYLTTYITDIQKAELYHNLAQVYSHYHNSAKAFYYKDLEATTNDSFYHRNIQMASADRESGYKSQKVNEALIISEKDRKINSDRFLGALIGAVVVCIIAFLALRNATLRRKANRILTAQKAKVEALADKLEEANQTKARLFSVISHDLRSPISTLYASLKMQELNSENGKSSEAVSSHIMHLLDTLEELLTWSKTQMDRFTLQPVNLRITDVYADLMELHLDAAVAKHITIVNKTERPVKIYTDENLLKTILRNVLANSIHHAPNKSTIVVDAVAYEGGVMCTISNEATATDAAMLEDRLQTATIGSSKHGLGNVLIKEFTEKLNADFEVAYRDGKVYLQIKVPAMQKQVHVLQPVV